MPYDFTTAIFEWFITVMFCVYFITFSDEFYRTTVYHPRLIFTSADPLFDSNIDFPVSRLPLEILSGFQEVIKLFAKLHDSTSRDFILTLH